MKPLRILPAAESEIGEASRWYEQRRAGLGLDFVAQVDAAFERIQTLPGTFPLWRPDRPYRKLQMKRFPFVVFYRDLEKIVEIVAVAHVKRRPGYWAKR